MHLLLPVSGKSSRFPGLRPKWMLTHPNGNLMLLEAIRKINMDGIESILVICLREHYEKYGVQRMLEGQFEKAGLRHLLKIIVIEASVSQPHTVYQGIKQSGISGSFIVKDSDNCFSYDPKPGNRICYVPLAEAKIRTAANKSYIQMNEIGDVVNIVEKHIISDTFCVGGYSFNDANEFCEAFESIGARDDSYVSHIIYKLMLSGVSFTGEAVKEFLDWGTLDDWNDYKSRFCTLFIDLDGTLVQSSAEYFAPYWGTTGPIERNVEVVNRLYDSGYGEIVITTTRTQEFEKETIDQLKRIGLKYHRLILGLSHCKRIIINDYAPSNPYRSCDAINLARNSSELPDMLSSLVSTRDLDAF